MISFVDIWVHPGMATSSPNHVAGLQLQALEAARAGQLFELGKPEKNKMRKAMDSGQIFHDVSFPWLWLDKFNNGCLM